MYNPQIQKGICVCCVLCIYVCICNATIKPFPKLCRQVRKPNKACKQRKQNGAKWEPGFYPRAQKGDINEIKKKTSKI